MNAAADRHLLFGLLALQNGIISQVQLVAAFQAWTLDKSKSLAAHLEARGDLNGAKRALLEGLVEVHLDAHGGDVEKSLAAVPAGKSTRESLVNLGDADIRATLGHVASSHGSADDEDPDRTGSYAVGTATSDGQRFRVLRPHARGGLGAVFVALDSELNREVALKQILDHHADDPTSRQRFLIEAEITGGLEHPGIVPVYGLGTYDGGRPYYAMRFIKGDSLKEAIERFHGDEGLKVDPGRRTLALRKLLRRFTDVCNAIDYAHSRGVLHRDIKPGNIIVGKHGETLVVDWGLAKPLGRIEPGSDLGERTLVPSSASGSAETLPGSALGTPAYMSPEQAHGDLELLGPRSDVYSLGSTLYCLLTGRPPFEGEHVGEVLRKVQRGDFVTPRSLEPAIDRALEAVCLKAMAFNSDARYSTCRALAEDIERWTADEAVTAWREPLTWRARRWGRRNRSIVTAGVAAILLVALAATASAVAIQRARSSELKALASATKALAAERAAKAEAQENFQTARKAVQDYLTSVSENTLLQQQGRADLRVLRKELLEGALKYYTGFIAGHANDPALQAELAEAYFRVGTITEEIGSKPEALRSMEQSLEIRRGLAEANPTETRFRRELANGLDRIGILRRDTGDMAGASSSIERALAIRQELAQANPADAGLSRELAASHNNLAKVERITGHPAEALRSFEQALTIRQELADARPFDSADLRALADTLHELGRLQGETGHADEAIRSSDHAAGILEKLAGADPYDTAARSGLVASHMLTGSLLRTTGRPEDALRSFTRAMEIQRELAEANPSVTEFRSNLARSYFNMGLVQSEIGRPEDALRSYAQAMAIHRRLVEANPAVTAFRRDLAAIHVNIGVLQGDTGHPEEAVRSYEQALAIFEGLAKANPTVTEYRSNLAQNHVNIGFMRRDVGRPDKALKSFRRAQQIYQELADANPTVIGFRSGLARTLNDVGDLQRQTGQVAESLRSHERARELFQGLADANPTVTAFRIGLASSHNQIGIVRSATGQPAEALRSYDLALAVRQQLADANPATFWIHSDLANSHSNIGFLHRDNRRPAEALRSFDRARAIYQRLAAANPTIPNFRSSLALCHTNIGQLERHAGRLDEALRSFERARIIWDALRPTTPDGLYDKACLLSQISALGGQGRSAADRAMRLLHEAVGAGFRDRAHMNKDSDLDPLRSRPDFQLLMLDLTFPAQPFAQ